MAHVGKIYPYADRRDLSICSVPMQWLGKRLVLPREQLYRLSDHQFLAANQLSDEVIIDADAGTLFYSFPPFVNWGLTWTITKTYELTFASTECQILTSCDISGNLRTTSYVGPVPQLQFLTGGQITFTDTSVGQTYIWTQAFTRAARWAEMP